VARYDVSLAKERGAVRAGQLADVVRGVAGQERYGRPTGGRGCVGFGGGPDLRRPSGRASERYDYAPVAEPIGPYHPLARAIRQENVELVRDYWRREGRPAQRGGSGAEFSRGPGARNEPQQPRWRAYGTEFDIGAGRGLRGGGPRAWSGGSRQGGAGFGASASRVAPLRSSEGKR
jgi:hypothetical protein